MTTRLPGYEAAPLKQQMEEVWAVAGCADPLHPARWKLTRHGDLLPNHDPFVPDEDDGDPADPLHSR